ncbi:MAG: KAP family NTPase [Alphaproteobacteria bacterium]|nr:KAP family NTPase [Alphaproteobacteria bacterium]
MDEKYNAIFTDGKPDKLNIASHVIGFAHVIEQSLGESKVYAISAPFGIGKTFFCEKLKGVLNADSVPVTIMNIWEMDFYGHPLIPILLKLKEFYRETVREKALPFPKIPALLRWIKSGIAGLHITVPLPNGAIMEADGKHIVDTNEALKENAGGEVDIYTEYIDIKSEIETIKVFLRTWAKSFNDKPVVVIIDELDRCRPDYAVKTLEVLKHFFEIPGLVFVLAIDEEQLKSSVETLFGTKNFDGYKRKFINNSFLLPPPDKVSFTNFLYEKSGLSAIVQQIEEHNKDLIFKIRRDGYQDYINRSFFGADNAREIENCKKFNELQTSESIIKRYFAAYSIWFKFTLRQMEQIFDRLTLFSKEVLGSDILFSPDLAVLLTCLHEFDLKLYSKLREKGFIGYSDHLFSLIIGTNTSMAFKLYEKDSFDMIDKLDRKLVPTCPQIPDFSTLNGSNQTRVIINDNVERFFVQDPDNPKKWLLDAVVEHQKNPIDNKCRIGIVIHPKSNAMWEDVEPDINTAAQFNLEQFRKDYFDKMDFISNFK